MDDIVKEFLAESCENLDRMDRELVELEKDPTSSALLASIFRTIHTIKGTSGFLGFSKLESVAHAGENLLSPVRDGKLALTPAIATGLLTMIDVLRAILRAVEATSTDGEQEYPDLITELARLLRDGGAPAAGVAQPAGGVAVSGVQEGTRHAEVSESSVRVDVTVLDQLMNLVGELVLARNRILQCALKRADQEFLKTAQPLNMITTDLRKRVMKARMQPVSNVFGKFPRVVRDVALSCGKQVEIVVEGSETELDRTIIEAIKDPLTHLVRNSVDHGIESPAVRTKKGKQATGTLKLKALHESGYVTIEISDDGAGIDREAIKKKGLEKGLINLEQSARMSDREILNLIFLPGFSTAAQITNVSGRGVGMDVVRTNIEKVGGTVEVESTLGQGTRIKIKIPLTLTIIPVLMVKSGGERFAIPQVNLLELVRLRGNEVTESIEMVHDAPVCRLRNRLLPLVFLSSELSTTRKATRVTSSTTLVNIAVLQADNHQFGLIVDDIEDTEEIVVKPLDDELKGIPVFAGTTIRGNGEVALILDVLGLAHKAHALGTNHRDTADQEQATAVVDIRNLLLFQAGDDGQFGIPASAIVRLEKIPRNKVERSARQNVVRYRGEIMRLLDLASALGRNSVVDADVLQVLVCLHQGRHIGLVIDRIVDVVRDKVVLQERAEENPNLQPAIFGDRVVDLLDMPGLLANLASQGQFVTGGM